MPTKRNPASKKPIEPSNDQLVLDALMDARSKTGSARGVAINNALLLAMGEKMPPERARSLREYTLAMMAPLLEHADGIQAGETVVQAPVMTYQELVTVLLAGALLVQTDRILHRTLG